MGAPRLGDVYDAAPCRVWGTPRTLPRAASPSEALGARAQRRLDMDKQRRETALLAATPQPQFSAAWRLGRSSTTTTRSQVFSVSLSKTLISWRIRGVVRGARARSSGTETGERTFVATNAEPSRRPRSSTTQRSESIGSPQRSAQSLQLGAHRPAHVAARALRGHWSCLRRAKWAREPKGARK